MNIINWHRKQFYTICNKLKLHPYEIAWMAFGKGFLIGALLSAGVALTATTVDLIVPAPSAPVAPPAAVSAK